MSGHVNLTIAGALQTFSFTAVQHQDADVSGRLTLDSRAQDVIIQGDVTCLVISGSEATIGGIITHVTRNSSQVYSYLEGQPFVFRVRDGVDEADLSTDVAVGTLAAGGCAAPPTSLQLVPVEAGEVSVKP